jgi:hypothetical protein
MPEVLCTLLAWMEVFRPALTRPGFANALVVFAGWVRSTGIHAVTEALVVTDVARRRHHERFHRFFSRGTWSPDHLGELLFRRLVAWVAAEEPILAAVDDTLAAKKGPHVFGIGCHLDAVRSTKSVRVFCFGHVWVVLSVVVRFPFARRAWAVPVLFRLYRTKKDCARRGHPYRKKTLLARELVDIFATWTTGRVAHITADSAYCNDTLMRGLPPTIHVIGAIRPDAVLTALPSERRTGRPGRPRIRGRRLPTPKVLAQSDRTAWQRCRADLYGRVRTVYYKAIDAQWYRGSGSRLVRIVVVRVEEGAIGLRVFLSTVPTLSPKLILETYAHRWAIEVSFRDLKQHLGFADSSARTRAAVERTAPFVGYIYTTLVLWFADGAWMSEIAAPPIRPWYRHKSQFSFADVLRAAQRTLAPLDVLDPRRSLANLHESRSRASDRRRVFSPRSAEMGP